VTSLGYGFRVGIPSVPHEVYKKVQIIVFIIASPRKCMTASEYIGQQRDRWIVCSEKRGEGRAPIWIGGDPIIVSERFFVSPELALAAVEEFCSCGDRTNQIGWIRKRDAEWSFGYWDHPDVKIR
jgi:hypothetical protein